MEEIDVAALVQDNGALLADSWRYGWPPVEYRGDLTLRVQMLRAGSVRAYSISSSYGLSGWVLAGAAERLPRPVPVKHP